MKLTGARILMECLREQKVDTIFGYPGGTILNVYDALYDCKEITHILTSHEQGAAHAADGYARSTGKVGVCFATSGPGATNLTTGIATAYMDSSSVVFISCNVPQNLIGRDAFQEVDITGITMPITKSTYLVRDVTKLADTVREAFALARSGRPGPVVIDITRDVTSAECDYEPLPLEQHAASGHLASLIRRAYTSSLKMPEADLDDVEKLVEMIAESKKPMLICGGGVNGRAVPACLRQGHALRQLLDIQLRQIVLAALRHLAGKLIGVEILEGKALAHGEITVEIVRVAVIGIVAAQAGGLRPVGPAHLVEHAVRQRVGNALGRGQQPRRLPGQMAHVTMLVKPCSRVLPP